MFGQKWVENLQNYSIWIMCQSKNHEINENIWNPKQLLFKEIKIKNAGMEADQILLTLSGKKVEDKVG